MNDDPDSNHETKETGADRIMRFYRDYFTVVVRNGLGTPGVVLETTFERHGVCVSMPHAHARMIACDLFVAAWINGGRRDPFTDDEIVDSFDRVQKASRP